MQPWHVFGGSINAVWQRRIGGQKASEQGGPRGTYVAPGGYEGRMTESRELYWLLGTIVTFAATIYDDWNSGRYASARCSQTAREDSCGARHLIKLVQLAAAARERELSLTMRGTCVRFQSRRTLIVSFNADEIN